MEIFWLFDSLGTNGLSSITECNVENCNSDKIILFFDEAKIRFNFFHATEPHLQF